MTTRSEFLDRVRVGLGAALELWPPDHHLRLKISSCG